MSIFNGEDHCAHYNCVGYGWRYDQKNIRRTSNLIPSNKQWNSWSLPSKLTAIGTLVGILSFGSYLVEKGYGVSEYFSQE